MGKGKQSPFDDEDDRWKKKGHVHKQKLPEPDVCPDCWGTGSIDGEDCPRCQGEGVLLR